jgi:G3E family GTPase
VHPLEEPTVLLPPFFQGDIHSRPEAGIQELMRAVLVRTNFVPVVRRLIGWRGLKQFTAPVECWTAKIHGFAGVYGFFFNGLDPAPGWVRGRFVLNYFPEPDEELVERCSLQAAALTQGKDYLQRVRQFLDHPELTSLFSIGCLSLAVDLAGKGLGLGLESLSEHRTLSEDGVRLPRNGQMVQVIEPGGCDQDFPAFDVASGFFNVLAASTTFNLGQPPAFLREHRSPGSQLVLARSGAIRRVEAEGVWNCRLVLGYGEGRFQDLGARDGECGISRDWRPGEPIPPDYQDRLWWKAHELQGAKTIDKKILGIDERPPLIILTGFLGSGKTGFLQHFIEYQTQRSRFVAVVQNEIGAVGLDGKLIDYTVTEIDEGCVCCSLAGSLKRAIHGILSEFHPDIIIVETTGLANPLNLLDEMGELEDLVRFDCTLTVVDALNIEPTLSEHAIAADQIRAADVLMLNKKDLVSPARLDAVTDRLREINPQAPLFLTANGDLNPALVLEVDDRPPRPMPGQPTAFLHNPHLHDGLWSQTITLLRPLDRDRFLKAMAQFPPSIFRAKGIIEFSDDPQPMLFQYVAGRHELSVFPRSTISDRFLTLIGKGDDPGRAVFALQPLLSPGDS